MQPLYCAQYLRKPVQRTPQQRRLTHPELRLKPRLRRTPRRSCIPRQSRTLLRNHQPPNPLIPRVRLTGHKPVALQRTRLRPSVVRSKTSSAAKAWTLIPPANRSRCSSAYCEIRNPNGAIAVS